MLNTEITLLPQLMDLIEFRGQIAGNHNKRMSKFVGLILNNAKNDGIYTDELTDEYIKICTKYVIFHDVGKIAIPDSILNAQRRLTEAEYDLVNRHAEIGAAFLDDMLRGEDEMAVKIAKEIALYHHENWDGSGGPFHLSEYNIPLCARATAIADVFDALTSPRCYKKTMDIDNAIIVLTDEAKTNFDPALIEVFLKNKEELKEIIRVK